MAKSRLAPLKKMTIPRLELQAATLAVRQDALLRRELGLELSRSQYWTDSTIVLQYHPQHGSEISDLRSQPGGGDTRRDPTGGLAPRTHQRQPGRRCLTRSPSAGADSPPMAARAELPRASPGAVAHPGETACPRHRRPRGQEAPRNVLRHPRDREKRHPIEKLVASYSNWTRLLRVLACFTLTAEVCHKKASPAKELQASHVQKAEEALVIHIQAQHYGEELRALSRGGKLPPSSLLLRLRPVLIGGVLVALGRLRNADLPDETKAPAVLPHQHPAVESLVRHVHEKTAYSGREYVLAELRRYWVIGGASLVKRVLAGCVRRQEEGRTPMHPAGSRPAPRSCHPRPLQRSAAWGWTISARFQSRQAGDERKSTGACSPAWSHAPYTSRWLTRWGATRSSTASSVSWLAGTGRSSSGRTTGPTSWEPSESYDGRWLSGTRDASKTSSTRKGSNGYFNPPAASHMGGVWERQIRSVRRILAGLTQEQVLSYEMLTTLLVVAEGIINNRPITPVSSDPADLEPLTPESPADTPTGNSPSRVLQCRGIEAEQEVAPGGIPGGGGHGKYLQLLRQRN